MTAMVGESLFLDVAKIAITCVGFASVVAALRHPKNEKWRYAEIMGLRTMIEFSFAAVIGGLLPSAVYLYTDDEPQAWFWTSTFLALFLLAEIILQLIRILRGLRESERSGSTGPRLPGLWLFIIVGSLFLLYFEIENARLWREVWPVAGGAIWLLLAWCLQFYAFMLFLGKEDA